MALTQVSSGGIADGAVTTDDLENSGVTAGTYGSSSAIPAITVDAKGRVTSATTNSIDTTAITNGTSNVSVASDGDITATRDGTTRLTVNSSGVTVVGTLTADSFSGIETDVLSTDVTQTTSRSFAANQNHAMVGPITLNSGVVFTIGSGSKLVILN